MVVIFMNYEIRQVDDTSDELAHHGILGQRWGIRRYQYGDGSLTPEGRKRYGSLKENLSKWRESVREKAATQKAERDAKKAAAAEERKDYLVRYGSASEVKKNIRSFSDEELGTIQQRFDKEIKVRDQINRIMQQENPSVPKEQKHDDPKGISDAIRFVADATKQSESTVSNAIKTYNGIAYAYNTLNKSGKTLKIIPTKEEKQQNSPPADGGT